MFISKKLLFFVALGSILPAQRLFCHSTTPVDEPEIITEQSDLISKLYKKSPTIVLLKSKACPYCESLSQAIKPYVLSYPAIDFYQVTNSAQLPLIATIKTVNSSLKIPGFPTILFINQGKIVDSQIGFNKQTLGEKISSFAKSAGVKKTHSKSSK